MAQLEPMDVDSIGCDFDDKENSLQNSNVLTNTSSIEKGYEELDVSELNMKLRFSITPASSPMSRSYTANSSYKVDSGPNSSNNTLVDDCANLTHSLNSTMTKSDYIHKSPKLPLQALSTGLYNNNDKGTSQRLFDKAGNATITITGSDDDNLSLPSTTSSNVPTPEATTPTKEIPKIDGGSPILRGLKSVLNIFRSSHSPVPPVEDLVHQDDILDELVTKSGNKSTSFACSSTPTGRSPSKRNSPLKESLVFKDDLEKELHWIGDEPVSTLKEEKQPVVKLFSPLDHLSTENTMVEQIDKILELNTTVEFMDISYKSEMQDKVEVDVDGSKTGIRNEVITPESDAEFEDCETTYTKSEFYSVKDVDNLNQTLPFEIQSNTLEAQEESIKSTSFQVIVSHSKENSTELPVTGLNHDSVCIPQIIPNHGSLSYNNEPITSANSTVAVLDESNQLNSLVTANHISLDVSIGDSAIEAQNNGDCIYILSPSEDMLQDKSGIISLSSPKYVEDDVPIHIPNVSESLSITQTNIQVSEECDKTFEIVSETSAIVPKKEDIDTGIDEKVEFFTMQNEISENFTHSKKPISTDENKHISYDGEIITVEAKNMDDGGEILTSGIPTNHLCNKVTSENYNGNKTFLNEVELALNIQELGHIITLEDELHLSPVSNAAAVNDLNILDNKSNTNNLLLDRPGITKDSLKNIDNDFVNLCKKVRNNESEVDIIATDNADGTDSRLEINRSHNNANDTTVNTNCHITCAADGMKCQESNLTTDQLLCADDDNNEPKYNNESNHTCVSLSQQCQKVMNKTMQYDSPIQTNTIIGRDNLLNPDPIAYNNNKDDCHIKTNSELMQDSKLSIHNKELNIDIENKSRSGVLLSGVVQPNNILDEGNSISHDSKELIQKESCIMDYNINAKDEDKEISTLLAEIKPQCDVIDKEGNNMNDVKLETSDSPIILSKGYNIDFDAIDDPFATKTNMRMSPPPTETQESFTRMDINDQMTISVRKHNSVTKKLEPIVQKTNNNKETIGNHESELTKSGKKVDEITIIADSEDINNGDDKTVNCITNNSPISIEDNVDTFENTADNGICTKFSIDEAQDNRSVFNLPEIYDMNFNPFESKPRVCCSSSPTTDFQNKLRTENNNETLTDCSNASFYINPVNVNVDLEAHIADGEKDIINLTSSSKNTEERDITVREVHTEDEDTVEGPFLEAEDLHDEIQGPDFGNEKDMMEFENLPESSNNDPIEKDEIFIDAETFEILLNKHKSNVVLDSGKESLFLKFDPLFANRTSSDGVLVALSSIQKKQSTPQKMTKTLQNITRNTTPVSDSSITMSLPEENNDVVESSGSKPMMVVTPAVNLITTPRKCAALNYNRRSMSFTSPAMVAIDRLLSLSGNTSLLDEDIPMSPANRNNDASIVLTQLRELLAERELHNHTLKCESKELKDRLTTLESQVKNLEKENEERLKKVNALNDRLTEKTQINRSMAIVVEEYERTIASLIAEIEQERKQRAEERMKLIRERDEQTTHLLSMEASFSDLHSKYEKTKQIILSMKANEEKYKKSFTEFDENLLKMQKNYELLKQHATSKLNNANIELDKINRAHEAELVKLSAMIKCKELHITSLEESLIQKVKANEELTAICDELINKVG